MYEALLTLHLLAAAIAFVTLVAFSAWAVGAPVTRGDFRLADVAWNVSGAGLVVFGIWLALDVEGYEIWDGWIVGALVLFGLASWLGARARRDALAVVESSGGSAALRAATSHWLRTGCVVAILVLMIWKPGA